MIFKRQQNIKREKYSLQKKEIENHKNLENRKKNKRNKNI